MRRDDWRKNLHRLEHFGLDAAPPEPLSGLQQRFEPEESTHGGKASV